MRYLVYLLIASIGLLVIAVAFLWWSSTPPSEASLQEQFTAHRLELDQLLAMMNQDAHMVRIAKDFTWKDESFPLPASLAGHGISPERWDRYRALFQGAGIRAGVSRLERSVDIEFIIWTFGLVTGGISESYVHCGAASGNLVHTEPECRTQIHKGVYSDQSRDIRYERLADDWYLSEERD